METTSVTNQFTALAKVDMINKNTRGSKEIKTP
jgi:hypothetical protein